MILQEVQGITNALRALGLVGAFLAVLFALVACIVVGAEHVVVVEVRVRALLHACAVHVNGRIGGGVGGH